MTGNTEVPLASHGTAPEDCKHGDGDVPRYQDYRSNPQSNLEPAFLSKYTVVEQDYREADQGDACIVDTFCSEQYFQPRLRLDVWRPDMSTQPNRYPAQEVANKRPSERLHLHCQIDPVSDEGWFYKRQNYGPIIPPETRF